jgi:hypothetical protein
MSWFHFIDAHDVIGFVALIAAIVAVLIAALVCAKYRKQRISLWAFAL